MLIKAKETLLKVPKSEAKSISELSQDRAADIKSSEESSYMKFRDISPAKI
jgi:hypothetical protein